MRPVCTPGGWAACCQAPGRDGLQAGKALPWPELASALSLARFLRLHSPLVGATALRELLGMNCFKLVPPLDCAEDKG